MVLRIELRRLVAPELILDASELLFAAVTGLVDLLDEARFLAGPLDASQAEELGPSAAAAVGALLLLVGGIDHGYSEILNATIGAAAVKRRLVGDGSLIRGGARDRAGSIGSDGIAEVFQRAVMLGNDALEAGLVCVTHCECLNRMVCKTEDMLAASPEEG